MPSTVLVTGVTRGDPNEYGWQFSENHIWDGNPVSRLNMYLGGQWRGPLACSAPAPWVILATYVVDGPPTPPWRVLDHPLQLRWLDDSLVIPQTGGG